MNVKHDLHRETVLCKTRQKVNAPLIGICFSGARHDGTLSLGREPAGAGPAGPIGGYQGS